MNMNWLMLIRIKEEHKSKIFKYLRHISFTNSYNKHCKDSYCLHSSQLF